MAESILHNENALIEHLKNSGASPLTNFRHKDTPGGADEPSPAVQSAYLNLREHPDFNIVLEDLARICRFGDYGMNMYDLTSRNIFLTILTRFGINSEDIIVSIAHGRRGA